MSERAHRLVVAFSLLCALAGCTAEPSVPAAEATQAPAIASVGDVTVRATTLPTAKLSDAMAREYGVPREPGTVLLVVGMRRGPELQETSLAGRVTVQATDLLGARQRPALREVRSGGGAEGFVDYVGTISVSMPDTVRYEIVATPAGGAPITLRFNRDYFP
jgi:hypothetical protein